MSNPSWKDRITVNPDQCGGATLHSGMRIRGIDILGLLASGLTQTEILRRTS
ncbi:MAG TPA: DUF433 domain-containing protein [Flavipsychrobacter sp.]|nr:DUF433 domain-containing protein [Flavipsychrobacter sp.]